MLQRVQSRDDLFQALPLAAVETIANLLCAVEVEADTTIIKEVLGQSDFTSSAKVRQKSIQAEDSLGLGIKLPRYPPEHS